MVYFFSSQIKYKEGYEKMKGKLVGVKAVEEDSQMAHSLQMSKLQSDLEYRKGFEDTKNQFHVSMDMVNLVHAKKAQNLATDKGYRTALHHYTALPTDMKVAWAKWAYGLQSDVSPTLNIFQCSFIQPMWTLRAEFIQMFRLLMPQYLCT